MGTWKFEICSESYMIYDSPNNIPFPIELEKNNRAAIPYPKKGLRTLALTKNSSFVNCKWRSDLDGWSMNWSTILVYYDEDKVPIQWRKIDKYTRAQWECVPFDSPEDLVAFLNQLDEKFQFTAKVMMTNTSDPAVFQYWLLWSEYA